VLHCLSDPVLHFSCHIWISRHDAAGNPAAAFCEVLEAEERLANMLASVFVERTSAMDVSAVAVEGAFTFALPCPVRNGQEWLVQTWHYVDMKCRVPLVPFILLGCQDEKGVHVSAHACLHRLILLESCD
jgi:hypothetical protein